LFASLQKKPKARKNVAAKPNGREHQTGYVARTTIQKPQRKKRGAVLTLLRLGGVAIGMDAQILAWRAVAIAVTIAIVIVVIPIAVGAPPMAIFVPPAMTVLPAVLARFTQMVASLIGLAALPSMMLDSFMKAMIRSRNALLAIVVGPQRWRACEQQKSGQGRTGQRHLSRTKNSTLKFRLHPVLLFLI
jgi:hypothetical protein